MTKQTNKIVPCFECSFLRVKMCMFSGVTWTAGISLMYVSSSNYALEVIFGMFNCLHGVTVFVLHAICNRNVRLVLVCIFHESDDVTMTSANSSVDKHKKVKSASRSADKQHKVNNANRSADKQRKVKNANRSADKQNKVKSITKY